MVMLSFLSLLTGGVSAGPLTLRPGMTGVPDLGAIRCKVFNAMYPDGPTGMRQAALTWAEGYLYARSGKTMNGVLKQLGPGNGSRNFDGLTGHIVRYCASNPEAMFPAAVQSLARTLGVGPGDADQRPD